MVLAFRTGGVASDARIAAAIEAGLEPAQPDGAEPGAALIDGVNLALTDKFFGAIATYLLALERGDPALVEAGLNDLRVGLTACAELNLIPHWWAYRIGLHLLADLWSSTFHQRLPALPAGGAAPDWLGIRELFIALMLRRPRAEVDLWPSQIAAAERGRPGRRSGGVAADERRKDPNRRAGNPALPRR